MFVSSIMMFAAHLVFDLTVFTLIDLTGPASRMLKPLLAFATSLSFLQDHKADTVKDFYLLVSLGSLLQTILAYYVMYRAYTSCTRNQTTVLVAIVVFTATFLAAKVTDFIGCQEDFDAEKQVGKFMTWEYHLGHHLIHTASEYLFLFLIMMVNADSKKKTA